MLISELHHEHAWFTKAFIVKPFSVAHSMKRPLDQVLKSMFGQIFQLRILIDSLVVG